MFSDSSELEGVKLYWKLVEILKTKVKSSLSPGTYFLANSATSNHIVVLHYLSESEGIDLATAGSGGVTIPVARWLQAHDAAGQSAIWTGQEIISHAQASEKLLNLLDRP